MVQRNTGHNGREGTRRRKTDDVHRQKVTGIAYIYIYIYIYYIIILVQDSSVGIETRKGKDSPGIDSRWGRDFPHPSRPALEPTQPRIQ